MVNSRSTWPLADDLSETMREGLHHAPRGHFSAATIKALRARMLIDGKGERTALGERVATYLKAKGSE